MSGGLWKSDAALVATTTYSQDQAHDGEWSNRLHYDFTAATGYVTYRTASMAAHSSEAPSAISAWVFGSHSLNTVRLSIVDATGESHVSSDAPLDFDGCTQVAHDVDATWSHWCGNDDGIIDLPLSNPSSSCATKPAARPSARSMSTSGGEAGAAEGQATVEQRVERLFAAMRPIITEAIRKNNPRSGIKFNDMEATSASAGDALARMLMEQGLLEFGRATDEEVAEAREAAVAEADPAVAAGRRPEDLRVTRMKQDRTLKTMRGPVRCKREYLYFPDLKVGVFPPRHTP